MIIVLVTEGKHESVDYAVVELFDNVADAEAFVVRVSTGKQKHWTHAEILRQGVQIELRQPQD